ncbi:FtsQ-type POTRA domain-containing protein [bacterium]|nr:FtsQ-type POTRA domain-containing protein [bacterium]
MKSRAEQRKRLKRRRIVSLAFLILFALSSPFWSVWLTNRFAESVLHSWTDCNLKIVRYSGLQYLTTDSLETAARFPYGKSMFELDYKAIRKRLLDLPWTKTIALRRKLPDRVEVEVVERIPVATIRSDRVYALTEDGIVLPVPADQWVWDLPMITPPSSLKLHAGDFVQNDSVLALLSQVVSVKQASPPLWANLSEVYYHQSDIRATLLDPPVILKMNTSNEHRTWIALNELLKQQTSIGADRQMPAVIDLRIPGNIIVESPNPNFSSQESSGT